MLFCLAGYLAMVTKNGKVDLSYKIVLGALALLVSGIKLYSLLKNKYAKPNEIEETELGYHKKKVKVADSFWVEVPKTMRLTKELNVLAALQYAAEPEDLFFIVIDQSVTDFKKIQGQLGAYDESLCVLGNYRKIEIGAFQEDLEILTESELSLNYSGIESIGLQFDAVFDGVPEPLAYYVALVLHQDHIFYLMAWTTVAKKEKHNPSILAMLSSLKPVFKTI